MSGQTACDTFCWGICLSFDPIVFSIHAPFCPNYVPRVPVGRRWEYTNHGGKVG